MFQITSASAHHEIDVLKSFALEAAGGVDRLETLVETAAKQAHDDTRFLETASLIAADHVILLEKTAADKEAEDELDKLKVVRAAHVIEAQEMRIAELEATTVEQSKTIQSLVADVDIRNARILELKELEAIRYDDLKKQHARIVELEAMRDSLENQDKELTKQQGKVTKLRDRVNTKEKELSRVLKILKKASLRQDSNKRLHTRVGQLRGLLRKANVKLEALGMTAVLEKALGSVPFDKNISTHAYKRKLSGLPPTPMFAKQG